MAVKMLDAVIETAARNLPEGYIVHLEIERGSAWVRVTEGARDVGTIDGADKSLTEQVIEATRIAVSEAEQRKDQAR